MKTSRAALVLLLLVASPAAARQAVDPPARDPAPPGAPPPAGAPAEPGAPPPAREPLPARPPEPAPIGYPYPEPAEPGQPDQPSQPPPEDGGEPLPVAPGSLQGPPVDERAAGAGPAAIAPAAAEPATGDPGAAPGKDLAAAPVQELTEPLLPSLSTEAHHLAGLKAALRGDRALALGHYEKALEGEPDNLRWGAEYRQVVIAAGKFARGLRFLARLAKEHPDAAQLHLNLGYAFIDQVPVAGPLAQMGLAGDAVREFTAALALEKSWLGLYSRGSAYVFYPPFFGKTGLGIADLEQAIALGEKEGRHGYQALAWAALGDGFWRLGQRDAMRSAWRRGLEIFPHSAELASRLAPATDAELDAYLLGLYSPSRRIDTGLEPIWQSLREEAP